MQNQCPVQHSKCHTDAKVDSLWTDDMKVPASEDIVRRQYMAILLRKANTPDMQIEHIVKVMEALVALVPASITCMQSLSAAIDTLASLNHALVKDCATTDFDCIVNSVDKAASRLALQIQSSAKELLTRAALAQLGQPLQLPPALSQCKLISNMVVTAGKLHLIKGPTDDVDIAATGPSILRNMQAFTAVLAMDFEFIEHLSSAEHEKACWQKQALTDARAQGSQATHEKRVAERCIFERGEGGSSITVNALWGDGRHSSCGSSCSPEVMRSAAAAAGQARVS